MNIPTSFTMPSKASLAITESFAAESAAAAAVIKNQADSSQQATTNTSSKTVTRQRKKKVVMSRSETPIVSMDDIYTKLDKLAINNSFLRRSGSSSCGSISSTGGSINDPNNDEFYMNLFGNMSDDSMEIGSVDSDDMFIEETEKTSSSFFYNPTGAPVKSNRKPRRRGKKQSKTISEFCKNQQQSTSPTTEVVVVVTDTTTVPTLIESPSSSATSSALLLTNDDNEVDDDVVIAPVLPLRSILKTVTKRTRSDADGQRPNNVQFRMDEAGTTIVPDILVIQPIGYEYHSDVYYTDAEFDRTKTQAYYCVEDFLIDNGRDMMYLSQLINEAFSGSCSSMSTTGWSQHIQQESIRQLYNRWSSCAGRGLEAFLIPTLYHHNKDCINTILSYQQKLKQHRTPKQAQPILQPVTITKNPIKNRSRSVPMYDQQYLLAQEAVRQTEGSTRLAQLMALGDQYIVELYRKQDAEEEEQQRKKKEAALLKVAATTTTKATRSPGSPQSSSNILKTTTSWFTNRFGPK